ncbi:glutathione S-transferase [Kordiimonas sediminis]|uniref:Glutathione S-transferase n=1 Tax=Kordiimonas sediminis TaxID=1735581 RepID=A0A919E805_9PROT|nr:glutathione S-transferase family protein [Kordiimonas sediminis]GHF24017.1 glutathione S-transferase [Kordiimonas sediminis]
MKLYGAHLSPYFGRCYLVMALKGQTDAVELGDIPGGMKSPAHMAANPTGKIPYLEKDDGTYLIESQVIAEYLDAILEGDALVPEDLDEATHALMICRIIDTYMAPAMERFWANRGYSDEEVKKAATESLPAAFDYLEHFITGGKYLSGDSWTIADAALIPWLFHMEKFAKQHGVDGFGDRPKLQEWYAHVSQTDIVKDSMVRAEKSLEQLLAFLQKK